ncbi:DUF6383 domain-containing protein [Parabacteroides hominis]|uniref:DUF6383 domain-containing protein n=1 Tax=Parabacteroides hominis TaxID=2763057 RepID=A0ABR7DM40_9BACT|nr:DUF6383 domain-containing protein [Parabacteroides hominis]MBC5632500.1 hypothetical protein [Parabacteroides hominis]
MNKSIFTLMTAALLMTGSMFSSAYAAAGDKAAVAYASSSMKLVDGTKLYLGPDATHLLKPSASFKVEGKDFVSFENLTGADPSTTFSGFVPFELRNVQATATGATFELWADGKQVVVKAADGTVADGGVGSNKLSELNTVFAVTYASADDKGQVNFNKLYTSVIPTKEVGLSVVAFTNSIEWDADMLNEYNSKGITFNFAADNLVGNVFADEMKAVKAGAAFDSWVAGTYFVKGAAADITKFKTTQSAENAKNLYFACLTDDKYVLNGQKAGEGHKFAWVKGETISAAAATLSKDAAFTSITEGDAINNENALTLNMAPTIATSNPVTVGAYKASESDTKAYVTAFLNSSVVAGAIMLPATLGTSTYLDASVLLKKDAVNTVNIYFTSGKQSVDGDANQQYEYHKYLVAGAGASDYQLEARAKSEIDLASPMTQWVVSGFNGKASFTLTNREAASPANELVLKLKATDVEGEYEIESATPAADDAIAAGVTANSTGNAGAKNQSLIGKTVRFNSVATTKTDGFLEMTKAEREGGFHLLFSGKVPGGIAEMYGVLSANNATGTYTPSENKGDYAFTAEVVKDGTPAVANYIINDVDAAYLDKDGNIVTVKDTLAVPSYKLVVGTNSASKKVLYLKKDAVTTIDKDDANEGEFFFRKNYDGTYAMGLISTNYAGSVKATAKAVEVNAAGTAFAAAGTATLYVPTISNVTIKFNDNSDATSLPAEPRHVSFDNVLGSVAMQMNKNNLEEGILSKEGLTFWLDTVGKADVPKFYISRGVEGQDERLFMFNSADSLGIFSEDDAQLSENKNYLLEGTASDPKAIFRAATLTAKDTLTTTVDGDLIKDDLKAYQYTIQLNDEDVDNEYVVKSVKGGWLYALNGKLGFTSDPKKAMVFTLGDEVPTSNDAIEVSEVKVIAGEGQIQIAGAQGKKVVVSNILGQVIANTVVASDNAAIAAPAGVVVVAVEGEAAVKAIVK